MLCGVPTVGESSACQRNEFPSDAEVNKLEIALWSGTRTGHTHGHTHEILSKIECCPEHRESRSLAPDSERLCSCRARTPKQEAMSL